MIKLVAEGAYRLVRTKDKQRMLSLGKRHYLWSYAQGIGEILTLAKSEHEPGYTLARGVYRIYSVAKEPRLTDLEHLELSVGDGEWQGYLLLTGLPRPGKIRSRIVPTGERVPFAREGVEERLDQLVSEPNE